MRSLFSVSVLVLSLAMAPSIHAEDWFRMNMSSSIQFSEAIQDDDSSDGDETDLPPDHGKNSGDRPVITASGGMFRSLAPISIPVLVDNGSGGYVLYDDHPDLDVIPSGVDGQFTLEGELHSSGTVLLNATDMLSTPAEPVELTLGIYDPLVAYGPTFLGTIRSGSSLAFDFSVDGSIGNISWELLGITGLAIHANGRVTGTPSIGTYSISARATDAFDNAQDTTDPVQLRVAPNLSVAHGNISTGVVQ